MKWRKTHHFIWVFTFCQSTPFSGFQHAKGNLAIIFPFSFTSSLWLSQSFIFPALITAISYIIMLSVIMDKGPIYMCCNFFFFQLYITLVALSTFVFPALIIAICYTIILFVIMDKGPIYICCNIFFFQLYITLVALSTFVFPALIIAICYTIILFVIMDKGPIYICCNIFFFQLYITLVALSTFVFPALIIAICYTIILFVIWDKGRVFTNAFRGQSFRNREYLLLLLYYILISLSEIQWSPTFKEGGSFGKYNLS